MPGWEGPRGRAEIIFFHGLDVGGHSRMTPRFLASGIERRELTRTEKV